MTGSTYDPQNVSELEKSKLHLNGLGKNYVAPAGVVTTLDLKISDDMLLTGASLICKGQAFGDKVDFQVVDVDGVFPVPGAPAGYFCPPGTVLNQFITGWGIRDDAQFQFQYDAIFPAKIFAGLYLRGIYHSTGSADVLVAINYRLHLVLV